MKRLLKLSVVLPLLLLSACVTVPTGPSAMSLPGTGRSFDQFRYDDVDCRGFASYQVGGATSEQVAVDSGVKSAATGAVLGALAGAAINGGDGAAVGAAGGAALGGLVGTSAGATSSYELQRRYDAAYVQCMYAKGHRVPVYGNFTTQTYRDYDRGYAPAYPPPPPPRPR
jgi:hypothetical protein